MLGCIENPKELFAEKPLKFTVITVSDYEMRQRRYCSLPESASAYNPRNLPNELYRLRSFSIKPNGSLIKHGDQIATRRKSRSSAGSTTNTSRYVPFLKSSRAKILMFLSSFE